MKDLGVVDNDATQEPVELLGIDPMAALDLAVEPWGGRPDVDVPDPAVEQMPVEGRLELRTIVGLDHFHFEWKPLEDLVDELDRGLLVAALVDAKDAQPGAVVDRGELVVAPLAAPDRGHELHVDLDPVPRQWLLVAGPTFGVVLVALGTRQAVEVQALQDPPDLPSGPM